MTTSFMASRIIAENNRQSTYSNKISRIGEVSHSFEKNAFAYVSPGKED